MSGWQDVTPSFMQMHHLVGNKGQQGRDHKVHPGVISAGSWYPRGLPPPVSVEHTVVGTRTRFAHTCRHDGNDVSFV